MKYNRRVLAKKELADFRDRRFPDGNPFHFHRFFRQKQPFHGNQEISANMYLMYTNVFVLFGVPAWRLM